MENLENSVNYQDGAVVSKTLLKKQAGSVTVFAFDSGQGLSEHTAPFDAMVIILDGKAEITIAGKTSAYNKGDMVIMPAGKPHSLKAAEKFKMLLVMIKSE